MDAVKIIRDARWRLEVGDIARNQYEELIAPLRDVEAVVRCRDCKHNPLETWFDCPLSHMKYDGDRWCWKGERKDGEAHDTK